MDKEKNILIKRLFTHLEGMVVIPTIVSFKENDIIDTLLNEKLSIQDTSMDSNIQPGYLNVGLNTLASMGILSKETLLNNVEYEITIYGINYFKHIHMFNFYNLINTELENFVSKDIKENDLNKYIHILYNHLPKIISNLKKLYNLNSKMGTRIAHQIEGVIIYPLLIWLAHYQTKNINKINEIIESTIQLDMTTPLNTSYDYFISRAKSYGVTASYQPVLSNLNEVIFNGHKIVQMRYRNKEIHVNRRLNVWGSGGAHKVYFRNIDNVIIDIFNKPINLQPIGIADMGCGDGMFLKHLFELIKTKTIRGKHLDKHPLKLIGADLNQEAIKAAKYNLEKSYIKCNFLISDISNPRKYKLDLRNKFRIEISDLLHVRSFLDHNRIYKKNNLTILKKISISDIAYAHKGEYLKSEDVTNNLIEHFMEWKKYISKFGLLALELHGLNTSISQSNENCTPSIAYEATHGYSDQFIVEYDIFLECAKAAGLKRISKYSKVFPDENLVTISLNMFK